MTAFKVPNKNTAEMTWVRAPISGAKWLVHRELAPILLHIVTTAEQRGYLFDYGPNDVDDDWGYAYRKIAGTNVWSNHSGGTAVDIDAQEYPQGQLRRQPPSWLIFLFAQWGWSYGGEFGKPDPMHFEFRGSVEKARQLVAMLAASYIKNVPVPVPVGTPSPEDPMPKPYYFVFANSDVYYVSIGAGIRKKITDPAQSKKGQDRYRFDVVPWSQGEWDFVAQHTVEIR